MDINWFPGHMAKALRNIREHLALVDAVVETCDARIPRSSRNPELLRIIRNKPQIIVLNKADLADPEVTKHWTEALRKDEAIAIPCNSKTREGFGQVVENCFSLCEKKLRAIEAKGRKNRPLRLMVVGIPNTGKSTLINSMTGRRAAQTSDRPGVTRGPQWVRSKDGRLEWLDMPGVLWPRLETAEQKLSLSATGAIKDQVLPIEEVAFFLFRDLLELYPDELISRYKLRHIDTDPYEIYLEAARMRGCIRSGGKIDELRFAELFINEFRGGQIGRISLEKPEAAEEDKEEKNCGTRQEEEEDEDFISGSY